MLLIAVVVALMGGFDNLTGTTDPFTDSSQATAIKQGCTNACEQENKLIYCCAEYELDSNSVMCNDTRLELPCSLDCTNFEC